MPAAFAADAFAAMLLFIDARFLFSLFFLLRCRYACCHAAAFSMIRRSAVDAMLFFADATPLFSAFR